MLQRSRARSATEWSLAPHPGAKVVELTRTAGTSESSACRLRKPSRRDPLARPERTAARARKVETVDADRRDGNAHHVRPARSSGTTATVTPPAVLEGRGPAEKVFALPGGAIVHAFFGMEARQVAVVTYGAESVGIVSTTGDHVDVVRAAQQLTRPGSP